MYRSAKIFAPATVANVNCGYDVLGFAIHNVGDEIIARPTKEVGEVRIKSIHNDSGKLPRQFDKNTAGVAALEVLRKSGYDDVGIELEIFKKMPFGSGMGSSAASAVAGAMAANEALGRPFVKSDLLEACVLGEQVADGARHADNVAPSLFGGFVLIRDNDSLDCLRVPSPPGLYCVLVHPNLSILTEEARAILSNVVALKDHIRQSGNLAALMLGLYRGDFELIGRSLQDHIIEPQRSKLIIGFDEVKQAAMECGALGFGISGAGPSVFALCDNSLIAEKISHSVKSVWSERRIESQAYISEINHEGAILL